MFHKYQTNFVVSPGFNIYIFDPGRPLHLVDRLPVQMLQSLSRYGGGELDVQPKIELCT